MYLYADLDAFFVSVEQALDPSLKGKPVIVGGPVMQRGVVASASYEARKFGICSGITSPQLVHPFSVFLKGNFEYYEEYSKRFHKILTGFSPDVRMASIDEAYVDIKGTRRLFGTPLDLAVRIKKMVNKELNIPLTIGIGRTKIFSKIVCEYSKPDGLMLLQEKDEIKFLSGLKVGFLPGIGPKHKEILNRLNIHTIGDLLKTPESILSSALGSYSKLIKFFVRGGDFNGCDGMKSVSRETTLPQDTADPNLIYALFLYLIERGCTALRRKRALARTLTVKVRFSDFRTVSKRTTIPMSNAPQIVFENGVRILERLFVPTRKIRLIGIALSNLFYDNLQPTLFMEKQNELSRLNYAVDRLRDRFGFNIIHPANRFFLKIRDI